MSGRNLHLATTKNLTNQVSLGTAVLQATPVGQILLCSTLDPHVLQLRTFRTYTECGKPVKLRLHDSEGRDVEFEAIRFSDGIPLTLEDPGNDVRLLAFLVVDRFAESINEFLDPPTAETTILFGESGHGTYVLCGGKWYKDAKYEDHSPPQAGERVWGRHGTLVLAASSEGQERAKTGPWQSYVPVKPPRVMDLLFVMTHNYGGTVKISPPKNANTEDLPTFPRAPQDLNTAQLWLIDTCVTYGGDLQPVIPSVFRPDPATPLGCEAEPEEPVTTPETKEPEPPTLPHPDSFRIFGKLALYGGRWYEHMAGEGVVMSTFLEPQSGWQQSDRRYHNGRHLLAPNDVRLQASARERPSDMAIAYRPCETPNWILLHAQLTTTSGQILAPRTGDNRPVPEWGDPKTAVEVAFAVDRVVDAALAAADPIDGLEVPFARFGEFVACDGQWYERNGSISAEEPGRPNDYVRWQQQMQPLTKEICQAFVDGAEGSIKRYRKMDEPPALIQLVTRLQDERKTTICAPQRANDGEYVEQFGGATQDLEEACRRVREVCRLAGVGLRQ